MLDKTKHEIQMKNILKNIYSDRLLAPILGFKGGTACYFFYDLPRFSVDLDFDLLDKSKEEEVFERLKEIIAPFGEISEARNKANTLFFLLTFEKSRQKVKIEVSKREKSDNYEIKNMFGISVLTMVQEDIFANKLVAATERSNTANRDFFDIDYFFKNSWDINEEIIKRRTGKSLKEYLEYLIQFVEENVSENKILDGLGEVLRDAQKDSVKATLKRDLLFRLRSGLEVK